MANTSEGLSNISDICYTSLRDDAYAAHCVVRQDYQTCRKKKRPVAQSPNLNELVTN